MTLNKYINWDYEHEALSPVHEWTSDQDQMNQQNIAHTQERINALQTQKQMLQSRQSAISTVHLERLQEQKEAEIAELKASGKRMRTASKINELESELEQINASLTRFMKQKEELTRNIQGIDAEIAANQSTLEQYQDILDASNASCDEIKTGLRLFSGIPFTCINFKELCKGLIASCEQAEIQSGPNCITLTGEENQINIALNRVVLHLLSLNDEKEMDDLEAAFRILFSTHLCKIYDSAEKAPQAMTGQYVNEEQMVDLYENVDKMEEMLSAINEQFLLFEQQMNLCVPPEKETDKKQSQNGLSAKTPSNTKSDKKGKAKVKKAPTVIQAAPVIKEEVKAEQTAPVVSEPAAPVVPLTEDAADDLAIAKTNAVVEPVVAKEPADGKVKAKPKRRKSEPEGDDIENVDPSLPFSDFDSQLRPEQSKNLAQSRRTIQEAEIECADLFED